VFFHPRGSIPTIGMGPFGFLPSPSRMGGPGPPSPSSSHPPRLRGRAHGPAGAGAAARAFRRRLPGSQFLEIIRLTSARRPIGKPLTTIPRPQTGLYCWMVRFVPRSLCRWGGLALAAGFVGAAGWVGVAHGWPGAAAYGRGYRELGSMPPGAAAGGGTPKGPPFDRSVGASSSTRAFSARLPLLSLQKK